jgi:hypothetical protein
MDGFGVKWAGIVHLSKVHLATAKQKTGILPIGPGHALSIFQAKVAFTPNKNSLLKKFSRKLKEDRKKNITLPKHQAVGKADKVVCCSQ